MKQCPNCNAVVEDAARFCTACGTPFVTEGEQAPAAPQAPVYVQPMPQQAAPTPPVVEQPMSWFKFLIYFALFLGAVLNVVNGFNYISGGIYFVQTNGQVSAEQVYSLYGAALKAVDVFYGVVLLAMSAFGVYTRFRLAKYKKNGPTCLYVLYAAGAAVSLLYTLAVAVVSGVNDLATVVPSVVVSIAMILLNRTYFQKRSALFVN